MTWPFAQTKKAVVTVLTALLGASVLLTSCSPDTPATDVTALTASQAAQLAQTLHLNHQAGGATFTLTAKDEMSGQTITVDGAVNFLDILGRARVTGFTDTTGSLAEIAWTKDAVAEQHANRQTPAQEFTLRPAEPANHPVDRLIAIVHGLATTTPDNAQLIVQNPGSGFLRDDMLRGTDVAVLRYSQRSIYWIAKDTGRLLRFEGRDQNGGSPVVVDLLELGPQTIVLPATG